MAFVLETGVGLANANAYVNRAFVDGYHTDRGNTAWTGTDTVKDACIIRATEYIDKRFDRRFRGERRNASQSLSWPRRDIYRDSGYRIAEMPVELLAATAQYALRTLLYNVLAPDSTPLVARQSLISGAIASSTAVGPIVEITENIGPIETTKKFLAGNQSNANIPAKSSVVSSWSIPEYPEADMLLETLLTSSVSNRTVRA